jgi:hypothetical protein
MCGFQLHQETLRNTAASGAGSLEQSAVDAVLAACVCRQCRCRGAGLGHRFAIHEVTLLHSTTDRPGMQDSPKSGGTPQGTMVIRDNLAAAGDEPVGTLPLPTTDGSPRRAEVSDIIGL